MKDGDDRVRDCPPKKKNKTQTGKTTYLRGVYTWGEHKKKAGLKRGAGDSTRGKGDGRSGGARDSKVPALTALQRPFPDHPVWGLVIEHEVIWKKDRRRNAGEGKIKEKRAGGEKVADGSAFETVKDLRIGEPMQTGTRESKAERNARGTPTIGGEKKWNWRVTTKKQQNHLKTEHQRFWER